MHCDQADSLIDAYMDGELSADLHEAFERHAETCGDCRARVDMERSLRDALEALPIDGPSDGFFDRALAVAKAKAQQDGHSSQDQESTHRGPSRRRRWQVQLGGALAAGFVLWVAAGVLLKPSVIAPAPGLPEVSIAYERTTPVNLVFTSAGNLEDARVSLQLPAGVTLAGYNGRRQLTWTTDLKDGNNVLTLPLVATPTEEHASAAAEREIVARLEHGDETKTFRLKVHITPTTQGTVL